MDLNKEGKAWGEKKTKTHSWRDYIKKKKNWEYKWKNLVWMRKQRKAPRYTCSLL